jgi:hypothetical protein
MRVVDATGYEALAGCLDGVAPTTRPILLPAARARGKLAGGIPLLHDEDVYLDDGYARAAFERLLACALEQAELGDHAVGLADAAREHRLHVEHAVVEAFVGHWDHVEQLADQADVDRVLLAALVGLVVGPMLVAYAERLAPVLALGEWSRRYCPICGAVPRASRGAGDGDGDMSRAACSRCSTVWLARRQASGRGELADERSGAGGGHGGQGGHGGPPLRGGSFRLELAGGEGDEYDD